MKKITIALVAVFAFALTMNVAFARYNRGDSCCGDRRHKDDCCPKVEVNADTDTTVRNYIDVKADTGDNTIYGSRTMRKVMSFWGGSDEAEIETGNADAVNDVRTHVEGAIVSVTAPRRGSVDVDAKTDTYVKNDVEVKADSGDNRIRSSRGDADINTGDAYADNYTDTYVVGSDVTVE